jgi:uncharacterized protein YigE (DUF2233 family)/L-ascorbate metabolism protein UlaG (beta-lactamase superfamily)
MMALLAFSLAAAAEPQAHPCADRGDYTVCVAPAGADIRLFLNDSGGAKLKEFDAVEAHLALRGERLVFAMNAGMYHKDRAPVGALTIAGEELRKAVETDGPGNFHLKPNGVFLIDAKGVARVSETGEFVARIAAEKTAPAYATQSGPMLVINGEIHPKFLADSDSRKYRNGAGVREDGSAVFAISDRPVTFREFAQFMRDEMKTPDALYLDGSISRLYAPSLARNDGGAPMGPIVGLVAATASNAATYIANEGVMVEAGEAKFLFDPLMQDDRGGVYQLAPPALLAKLKAGAQPYDAVDAVFISHAHADHFSAAAMNDYLAAHPSVRLYAPAQAVAMMKSSPGWRESYSARIASVALKPGQSTKALSFPGAKVTGLRIPHAGGARTADVENILWRIEAASGAAVMHLGDGEATAADLAPAPDFARKGADVAFAPFWIVTSQEDAAALRARLNAARIIGVHVPVAIPQDLKNSGVEYFSKPGEKRDIRAEDQQ